MLGNGFREDFKRLGFDMWGFGFSRRESGRRR